MTDKEHDSEPGWNDQPGDNLSPLPEPWFIRDLRESRMASVKASADPRAAIPAHADRVLGRRDRVADDGSIAAGETDASDIEPYPDGERPRTWMYVGAAGLIAVVAVLLWLIAQPRGGGAESMAAASTTLAAPAMTASVATSALTGLCTSPATLDRLRSLVVSEAARRGNDADALAQAAAGLSLSVAETPDTSGEAGAVACRGWLSLVQPGIAPATAPISFRALPAAGGDARISIVQGLAPIVAALAAPGGAGRTADDAGDADDGDDTEAARPPRATAAPVPPAFSPPAPQPRFTNPSFDCRRVTSWANRAICADDSLAALDRTASAAFDDAAASADADTRAELEDGRRSFLARVQRCDDEDCIADVYNDRIDELRRYR